MSSPSPSVLAVTDVVAIFISNADGEDIASLVDGGTPVLMHIAVDQQQHRSSAHAIVMDSLLVAALLVVAGAAVGAVCIYRRRLAKRNAQPVSATTVWLLL